MKKLFLLFLRSPVTKNLRNRKTLKKLEKTRQTIEQDYYYMSLEMKELGILKNQNRSKDSLIPLETERKFQESEQTYRDEKANDVDIKEDDCGFDEFNFSKVLNKRRTSLQAPELPKSVENKRKFSLDSSGVPLSKSAFYAINNEKKNIKSALHYLPEENNLEHRSLCSGSFLKSDLDFSQKASQAYSARTQYSVKSGLTNPTTLSNLSNLTSNSQRRSSYLPSSSTRLPKIRKHEDEKKRQVSFGKVELNQLEIPTLYRHSNVAMEKFKLDPHFYLPNGHLKRRYSLPKLDETLDAIKNCRYIRRGSSEQEDNIDVTNIFKDIFQNDILSGNMERSFINEEDDDDF
ncbi:hypothetical protein BpHYR1_047471 [Brachionus plicatilis]|uniref:Uncharacterized protein n=1 Tax=Brachionus plicatilis TaxID=10195 RepID=A0A3M7T4N3_BRAPC|nr:hypothetical protein BpHYR1_047471 [Brachionus plicatilis]